MTKSRPAAPDGKLDQSFPPAHRVRHGRDFKRAFAHRKSVADDLMIVYGCENQLNVSRLGLSVSRKVGGAPTRNHWKRLIRETFRRVPPDLSGSIPGGIDFVVIPRKGATADSGRIRRSLPQLMRRVKKKLRRAQT